MKVFALIILMIATANAQGVTNPQALSMDASVYRVKSAKVSRVLQLLVTDSTGNEIGRVYPSGRTWVSKKVAQVCDIAHFRREMKIAVQRRVSNEYLNQCSRALANTQGAIADEWADSLIRLIEWKSAQGVACRNLASGDGIVAPQTIVLCTGVPIEREVFSAHPNNPETELGGVSLSVNGQLAGLRGVGPDGIVAILPNFNVGWRFRSSAWIVTPNGSYLTSLPASTTSPAMFSNFGERPQGYAWSLERQLWVIEQGPIPSRSTVSLICTGTRMASEVYVLLGGERIVAVNQPFPGFKGLEYVTFDLPANAFGNLSIQIVADGRASNSLLILVE